MADNVGGSPTTHTIIAAWVFGSLILLFYIGVFVFAPDELPAFKHKQLAIFSALLSALFTFFFVGTLKVNVRMENRWGRLGIQSGGGAAAFVLVLWWWSNPMYAPVQIQEDIPEIKQGVQKIEQTTGKIEQDTQTIVILLKNELRVKNDQIAFLQTQIQTQKPQVSEKAKALAKQIPETA
ncbi:MAG: hypothetical protein ACU836_14700, partial [Gammaproteobacteria bacterium]